MTQLHTTSLRRQASELLGAYGDSPKKLMLLHTAISLGTSLLVTTIGFLLSLKIADTGGLGGMATRSILSTAQSVLELAVIILLPFWEIGILRAALGWRKGENAGFSHLTEGFRRFVNVFSMRFWSSAMYIAVGFAIFYFSLFIFMMTPWAAPVSEQFATLLQATTTEQLQEMLTPELTEQLLRDMLPLMVLFGLLFGTVALFLFYRMRFGDFFVMEGAGGVKAIVQSFQLTRGNCLQVAKIDLHFWWFYLVQGLSVAVCYGDSLLNAIGINLPFGPDANFFLFYVAGIVIQAILFWQFNHQRLTTYCLAYDALQTPEPTQLPPEM